MESEAVKAFNAELTSVYETRPPITKKKIQDISKAALKGIKFYKHIVFSVEKFLAKCQPEFKIPCLYIIDAIIRQSKHTFKQKDVFGPRFEKNMLDTLEKLHGCPDEDKPKIARTLNLWTSNEVYPTETITSFLNVCRKYGTETDVEKVERIVKGDKANMAIYEGGAKSRPEKEHKRERHHREHSRFEATTPPGVPLGMSALPTIPVLPSDNTPANGVSEKTLIRLMQKTGTDFGGTFTTDIGLLKQAHTVFLPRLLERIQRLQEERGDNIKHFLSRDFDYSDEEDVTEEPPKRLTAQEIELTAEELLRDPNTIQSFQGLQIERMNTLNKIAMEAKQKIAAAAQMQPSTSGLPPQMPKFPGGPATIPTLPPGIQLPNLASLPGLGQQGLAPFNPALVNLLSGNPLFAGVQPTGLPPGLSGLANLPAPASIASSLPPGFSGNINPLQPPPPTSMASVNIANFMPNRPPPNMLSQLPNLQQLMQQQQQQQHKVQEVAQAQQEAEKMEARLRSDMERAMEERNESGRLQEKDRKDRDRRRDDRDRNDRSNDRNRDRRDGSRDRRRSRSRDRRDRDRDGRRRRSRSRDRAALRDPRDQNRSNENDSDRDRERQRRHMGLPSRAKPEHLTIASCTLWFGRLPPNCSDDEIKEALKDIGPPKKIQLVTSKACAYVTMNDRRAAYAVYEKSEKKMEIRQKTIKISWAAGAGVKNMESKYGDFWDNDKGYSQIPWNQLPANLSEISEGSCLDLSTLPKNLEGKVDEFGKDLSVNSLLNPFMGGPIPQLPGMPGALGAQFVLPPPGLGMSGAPGMGITPGMMPPGMTAGIPPPPGMVPPPGVPSFGMPSAQLPRPPGTGPHTPTKPPPTDPQAVVQQQLAALTGAAGFPPSPQGFPPGPPGAVGLPQQFGMPPPAHRGGFPMGGSNFRGVGRGGFNGASGERGGFRGRGNPNFRGNRGQWRGRGDGSFQPGGFSRGGGGGFAGGQSHFTGMPGRNLPPFPPPTMNTGLLNDDAQVTSTVNDEEAIGDAPRNIETIVSKSFEHTDSQPMDDTNDE